MRGTLMSLLGSLLITAGSLALAEPALAPVPSPRLSAAPSGLLRPGRLPARAGRRLADRADRTLPQPRPRPDAGDDFSQAGWREAVAR